MFSLCEPFYFLFLGVRGFCRNMEKKDPLEGKLLSFFFPRIVVGYYNIWLSNLIFYCLVPNWLLAFVFLFCLCFSVVADKVFVSCFNKEASKKEIEEVCFTIHILFTHIYFSISWKRPFTFFHANDCIHGFVFSWRIS